MLAYFHGGSGYERGEGCRRGAVAFRGTALARWRCSTGSDSGLGCSIWNGVPVDLLPSRLRYLGRLALTQTVAPVLLRRGQLFDRRRGGRPS